MADPTQVTGTPALNPPPPNDPAWLADTPATTDNYDVVIGNGTTTVGLLLYRGEDGGAPDKTYKTEAVDFQYAGTFVDRANVGSGYGDDQQSFWMTFTQKDWSGGIGQKYFRNQDPQSRGYWDGDGIDTTSQPGQVRLGPWAHSITSPAAPTPFNQTLFYANTVAAAKGTNAVVNFAANSTNTVVMNYTNDPGQSPVWVTQGVSGATKMHDLVDACVGENGQIYVLQAVDNTTATLSTISHIAGPGTATTLAWDNSTHITGSNFANCMCFWNGRGLTNPIYLGTVKGQLVQATMGSSATGTLIQDFGGGTIISLEATPKGIYVLYYSTTGEYKLFLYDGTTTVEVARLPKGWRYHPSLEQQLTVDGTSAFFTSHVMAYQDGVLYVSGMMPARDAVQSGSAYKTMRTAVWYYASGNSGLIWQSEELRMSHLTTGGQGPLCSAAGKIWFYDLMGGRLMSYSPETQGVTPECDLGQTYHYSQMPANVGIGTTAATMAVGVTTMTVTMTSGTGLAPGMVLTNTSRTADRVMVTATVSTTVFQVKREAGGTVAATQWNNGDGFKVLDTATDSVQFDVTETGAPTQPCNRLTFDSDHGVFYSNIDTGPFAGSVVNCNTDATTLPSGGAYHPKMTQILVNNYITASGVSLWYGQLISSLYDFDSSLDKYFRDIQWDGLTTLGLSPQTETASTVDLYYKLNDVPKKVGFDSAGLTLIQASAVAGQRYQINATGKSICIVAQIRAPGGSANSAGAVIRRMTIRAAPITPTYRTRTYEFTLFEDMKLKNGLSLEPRTPAQLRRNLETLIASNSPLTVSDAGVTSMAAMFDLSGTKIREMRPNEYIAYVTVREI